MVTATERPNDQTSEIAPSTERVARPVISTRDRLLILLISGVSPITFRRWLRGDVVQPITARRIADALAQVRAGVDLKPRKVA